MRVDNGRHIVEAARRRSEYTRAKAVQALRSLDAAGESVTFETAAKLAGVSRSWPMPSRTCGRRSSACEQRTTAHPPPRFRLARVPPTLSCCGDSKS